MQFAVQSARNARAHRSNLDRLISFHSASIDDELVMEDDIETTTNYDENEENHPKCCQCLWQCSECWNQSICLKRLKKFFTFLFTNLGLIILVICYCLFGAVLFEVLEWENEIEVKRSIPKIRQNILEDLWKDINDMDVFNESKWTEDITGRIGQIPHSQLAEFQDLFSKFSHDSMENHYYISFSTV